MADTDWDLVSSYAGLLCLATLSIYCGALGSLPVRPSFVTLQPWSERNDTLVEPTRSNGPKRESAPG